ncbi:MULTISPECIES: DeoR family transcriptional regulator [Trichocoleus]|uniref:DeoR family transcriptional regulator n=1 Tax=Trichocoleus desertorum GB2-A4 TaxID=2933944 RepID=A0ABV0J980_9CYAN|nr:DeoR family transcriptional regulator [Trichocoleus sp. FACHB-46]MBD1864717.1 DeoR family transcriptional regulator [Trichocoleus sp. FACHB-46]
MSAQPNLYNTAFLEGSEKLLAQSVPIAAVVSAPRPLRFQKNRSSANFSVVSPRGSRLRWVVLENGVPNRNIRFSLKEDRSVATDPVIYIGVRHGSITRSILVRSIYIADPTGARGNFQVAVYEIP